MAYNERKRLSSVEKFADLKHWEDRQIFSNASRQIRKTVGNFGVTISLVTKNLVLVKFGTRFGFKEVPRPVLFDSHTILSKNPIIISDTSQDWRTAANPLVTGTPNIRFYCGIPMITKGGQAIGAFSIFDDEPNTSIPGPKLEKLQEIVNEFMGILELPLENFFSYRDARYAHHHSQVDIDLLKLATKLGRATCTGGYMTIFEQDGSGSPYSRNLNFGSWTRIINKKIARHTLPPRVNTSICSLLSETGSVRRAIDILTKSINIYHKLDFTCVMEIRFLDLYIVPSSHFPAEVTKVNFEEYSYKDDMIKKNGKSKMQIRTLSKYGGLYDVESTDAEIWQKAFTSEYGLQLRNAKNNAYFNHALVMPFYRVTPSLVRDKYSQSKEGTTDLFLRTGGYVLGIFSQTSDTFFDAGKISRLFDHVQLVHKVCMS